MSDEAVAALKAGQVVLMPTDTVTGSRGRVGRRPCGDCQNQETARLTRACWLPISTRSRTRCRGRGRAAVAARALLPGPYTLVLPNPARRFRWLCGTTPQAIGIRVPELSQVAQAVVETLGFVAATSANVHGGPDPASLDEVPREILDGCGAVVDAGELPGTPSTVVDLTGASTVVLREGAVRGRTRSTRRTAALA